MQVVERSSPPLDIIANSINAGWYRIVSNNIRGQSVCRDRNRQWGYKNGPDIAGQRGAVHLQTGVMHTSFVSVYDLLSSSLQPLFGFLSLQHRRLRGSLGMRGRRLGTFAARIVLRRSDRRCYDSPASAIVTSPIPLSCTRGDVVGRSAECGRSYSTSR
jgi:hypothetical protein